MSIRFPGSSLFLLLAAALLPLLPLHAQEPVPAFGNYVTDLTGTLTPQEAQALNAKLNALEKSKGSQVFVLLVPTTGDEPIEDFAQRVFEAWKPGRKGVNDGILFIVAMQQHRMRIHTGYGLEGAVPDALGKRILDRVVAPAFREKKMAEGINAGVDALIAAIQGEELPAPVASRWHGVASSGWVWMALGAASLICGILGLFSSRPLGIVSVLLSMVGWGPVLYYLPEVLVLGSFALLGVKVGLGAIGIVNAIALLYFIGSNVSDSGSGSTSSYDSGGGWSGGSTWSSGSSGWSSDSGSSSSSDSSSSDGGGGGDSGGGGSSSDW